MGAFGHLSAVMVDVDRAAVAAAVEGGAVEADVQRDRWGHEPLFDEGEGQLIGHFPDDQGRVLVRVGLGQHLAGAQGVVPRAVGLDVGHRAGLNPPGVVD